jgi:uncharacterized protein YcfJ
LSIQIAHEYPLEDTMKKLALAIGSLATAIAPAAFGQYYGDSWRGDRYRGEARVIESRPVYEASNARQECWNPRAGHYEELRAPEKTDIGKGAAVGAVAGGVLGHQVDSGTGTAAGAILGGILGHQVERRRDRDEQTDLDRSRCRVVGDSGSGAVLGYDVRYEIDGREYVTRMNSDPGSRLIPGRDINRDGTPYS